MRFMFLKLIEGKARPDVSAEDVANGAHEHYVSASVADEAGNSMRLDLDGRAGHAVNLDEFRKLKSGELVDLNVSLFPVQCTRENREGKPYRTTLFSARVEKQAA